MTTTTERYDGRMARKSGDGTGTPNPWPKRLKELRDRLRLTQAEAAAKVRVSRRGWAAWEGGEFVPTPAYQLLISLLEDGRL